jgi:hypothetical protein
MKKDIPDNIVAGNTIPIAATTNLMTPKRISTQDGSKLSCGVPHFAAMRKQPTLTKSTSQDFYIAQENSQKSTQIIAQKNTANRQKIN